MSAVHKLVRSHLSDTTTFASVDPPEVLARRAGVPEDRIIRLNANENPYGASPKVSEALATLPTHLYPDPLQRKIRGALSKYTGVDPANIVCGAGSDELIDLLFRLFVSPGAGIIECDPTFGMYSFCARIAGARIISVPRDQTFAIDLPAIRNAIDADTRMIFLDSPNNPTGNSITQDQVRALLDTGLMVVVDEAYHEFCGETAAKLVAEYENLVVLRTFSKWAGIAGLRVGYGIMSSSLVQHIIDIKSPYNVNSAGEAALLASLEDADSLLHKVRLIVDERERMFSLLKGFKGVQPWPSGGNYLLCEFEPGRAPAIHDALAKRGIFVRNFSHVRLRDFFRISVGTPEHTDSLILTLAELA